MAFEQRSLDDYVDVAERITAFREAYPEGSLRPWNPAEPYRLVQTEGWEKGAAAPIQQTFLVVVAAAYRHGLDDNPGVGMAWEVFPGRTPYTRGSELQNAETSAWGRAIIAVGASDSKRGIASREEVRNRQAERDDQPPASAREYIERYRQMRNAPPEVDSGGAATVAEQTRMMTGPEPGTERGPLPPGEDPWLDGPAGLAPQDLPEDRHGTATADQIRTLQAAFTAKGIKDRDAKIAWLVDKFGPDIHSSKDLSYTQAARALQELR